MTITILPPAVTQFSDANGDPLASGQVFMYVPNSSTPKLTWQDSGATIPNANPIILNAAGEAVIFGSGAYRQMVYDSLGNLQWDSTTLDPGYAIMATFNGTSTTSVAIGTGSKTFTTQPGLQFFPGGTVNIASNASALNYMNGTVASYDTTTGILVVTVLQDGGSGTYSDWNIAVSGIQGPAGTVTSISIASTNGFAGSSSGGGTPQLTLSTSITGVLKGNGTALSAATAGTDYVIPSGSITGNAGTVTINANLTGPVTSVGNATSITAGSITEAALGFSNNTTANVTTSAHGLAPILPNNIGLFLNGVGGYSAPVVSSLVGTSTTSLTIATGSTTFTTQAGLTLGAGQYVIIPSNANSANYFFGPITSYSDTTLVVNVTVTSGSGTHADWNILISGPQGPTGGITTTGSPASGNLTKFSGSSTITNADLVGDVTTTGTVTTTIAANAVTNAKLATMAANTVKTNATAGSATPTDVALSTSNLFGRGSTGNIAPITLDSTLTMATDVLSATTATASQLGASSPDNTTITATAGVYKVTTSTSSVLGVSKPDGSTITVSSGVYSTTATSQLMTPFALGSMITAIVTTGTISANSTTAASNLTVVLCSFQGASSGVTPTGDSISGTWKAFITTLPVGAASYVGLFQRIA